MERMKAIEKEMALANAKGGRRGGKIGADSIGLKGKVYAPPPKPAPKPKPAPTPSPNTVAKAPQAAAQAFEEKKNSPPKVTEKSSLPTEKTEEKTEEPPEQKPEDKVETKLPNVIVQNTNSMFEVELRGDMEGADPTPANNP